MGDTLSCFRPLPTCHTDRGVVLSPPLDMSSSDRAIVLSPPWMCHSDRAVVFWLPSNVSR